jgi:hypothetical protein
MVGINPGLVWSFLNRPNRHYRRFSLPKGKGFREIQAPRVALKVVQKWLSVQLQRKYVAPAHVHGFVSGRSHLTAASAHSAARWVHKIDICDFFGSTPSLVVKETMKGIGYSDVGSEIVTSLTTLNGFLTQGSPTSPVLSNLAFGVVDQKLTALATKYGIRLTRYADDIVFSGIGEAPRTLQAEIEFIFFQTPWRLSEKKTHVSRFPSRLKVHGLLVHGERVRLTKGYRNRIRGFRHALAAGRIKPHDQKRIGGHLQYAKQVETSSS